MARMSTDSFEHRRPWPHLRKEIGSRIAKRLLHTRRPRSMNEDIRPIVQENIGHTVRRFNFVHLKSDTGWSDRGVGSWTAPIQADHGPFESSERICAVAAHKSRGTSNQNSFLHNALARATCFGSRVRTTTAGFPATIAKGGTSLVTTAPAATIAPRPILTPFKTVDLKPIQTSSSITTGRVVTDSKLAGTLRSKASTQCSRRACHPTG